MASFAMHLAIAKLYLKNHPELNIEEEEFVKGSMAPDLVPFNEKGRTHYGIHSAWSNPAKYLQENGKSIENSYERGYFLHLVTDYLFYHVLINIDDIVHKQNLEEATKKPSFNEWRNNQRNDFSVLEGEIEDRYEIQEYIDKLPEKVKKVMTRIDGELKIFERESLFKFLEDMAQFDLDKMAEELSKNPEADLINLYEKYCLKQEIEER